MKTIKTYEDFVNEEINLKKALATGALAAGMAFSNPATSQNVQNFQKSDTTLSQRVDNSIINVLNINKDQVSDIKSYESSTSIKLPEGFDPSSVYMKSTFLWNSNIPSAPFGGMIFLHSKNISFFIDIKSNWRFHDEADVVDWVDQPSQIIEYAKIPMYTGSDSYTQKMKFVYTSTGEVPHRKVIDFGLAKTINKNQNLNMKAYLGCGVFKTETEMVKMISEYYSTYYYWSSINQSSMLDNGESHKYITTKEYNTKLNVTGGLLFDFASGFSMGVGFDTNPGGINLSLGFNIRK
jgi:hypothetical protein